MGQGASAGEGRFAAWAAKEGRVEDLHYHLSGGNEVLLYRDEKGNGLMHYAAEGGYVKCVEVLVLKGMKLNAVNVEGYTPLHMAVIRSKPNAVRILLGSGAKVNPTNKFGITPLHLAAHHGKLNCMQVLLQYRANVNAQESWGQTPLMLAVSKGHIEVMVDLLRYGCDPWITEHKSGYRALHIAAQRDISALLTLLDDGANPNDCTRDGTTPLDVAIDNNRIDAVKILLEFGAQHPPRELQSEKRPSRLSLVAMATKMWRQPHSLKSLSRVAFRRTCGPGLVETWSIKMGLTEELLNYVLFREEASPSELTFCSLPQPIKVANNPEVTLKESLLK